MGARRLSDDQRRRVLELHGKGLSAPVIAKRIGTTSKTVNRLVRAAKEAR